jgi:hypothetical protein
LIVVTIERKKLKKGFSAKAQKPRNHLSANCIIMKGYSNENEIFKDVCPARSVEY